MKHHPGFAALFALLCCLVAGDSRGETLVAKPKDADRPVQLVVEILWGSIRVRGDATAREVRVVSRGDQPREVNGALVEVGVEGNRVEVRQATPKPGVFRSAHLEIQVPRRTDVRLLVEEGGDLWVRDVEGSLEITNLNGSVEVTGLAGAAAISNSNGSILARFTAVDPERDMIFSSLNGNVALCLPEDFSARVHLTTAGDPILSDFPIERDTAERPIEYGQSVAQDQSEVRGRIGSSDRMLRVATLNGEIDLQRCP